METNFNVVQGFLNQHAWMSAGNMLSTGDKLYSYQTCIAQWYKGQLIVNKTKYSVTTSSKHQSPLRNQIADLGLKTIEVTGVPIGAKDLVEYVEPVEED